MSLSRMVDALRARGFSDEEIDEIIAGKKDPDERARQTVDFMQAQQEFLEAEASDPNGIFTPGGSTAGGIFGDAPIVMGGDVSFDPGSVLRSSQATAAMETAKLHRAQRLELEDKRRLEDENRQLRAQLEAQRLEAQNPRRGSFGLPWGRKK